MNELFYTAAREFRDVMDHGGELSIKNLFDSYMLEYLIKVEMRKYSSPLYGYNGLIINMQTTRFNKFYFREFKIAIHVNTNSDAYCLILSLHGECVPLTKERTYRGYFPIKEKIEIMVKLFDIIKNEMDRFYWNIYEDDFLDELEKY